MVMINLKQDFLSSNSVSNHTRDKQIGLPLRGRQSLISASIIYLLAMKIYKLIMVSSFDSYSLFRENYWYVNYNKNKQCVHLFTFKSLFMVNFFILARFLSPSILMYSTSFRKSFSKVTCYLIYETSTPSLIFLLLHFLRLRSPSSTTSLI